MREEWISLCKRLGMREAAYAWYDTLHELYCAPDRFYHNLDHIAHCLAELRSYVEVTPIELAIWFHDAIYDTHSKNNEEQSAQLFLDFLKDIGVTGPNRTLNLIRVTDHKETQSQLAERTICDVDLAILGADQEIFDTYEANIRKEYQWVDEETYRRERVRVLRGLLNRPSIYQTHFFRGRYESTARINIGQSISRLVL